MNEPNVRTPARLDEHVGELVREDAVNLVWQGEITPTLLADLMGSATRGAVEIRPEDGVAYAVWIKRCWFDVARGRMVVHLRERGMAA